MYYKEHLNVLDVFLSSSLKEVSN